MGTNIVRTPFIRAVAARGYSSTLPLPISGNPNYEVKNTTLPNKLVVASADNDSPIARISIVFRAGSRNETPDNAGVVHALRVSAGNSTKNASLFAITRNIQQVGARLTATSDREVISYTLEGTRQAIEKTLPFLTEVATQQIFKPWEVSDNLPRQRLELATRPPQLRAVDLLHKAAFRRGLGNSLYSPKYQLGKISPETLQHYVATNFKAGRAAVVGLGVDHGELARYAQGLTLEAGEGTTVPSPYKGGEIRSDKGGDLAFIAVAGEGGSFKNAKEVLAFAVLHKAFGEGPQIKFATNDNGILNRSVGGCLSGQAAAGAINVSYADSGLFGILIAAPAASAGKLTESSVHALQHAEISDADVIRGKNQLKLDVLSSAENGTNAVDCIGIQAALLGSAKSPTQVATDIDAVTLDDVKAAFKKVSSSNLSIASVGNLQMVPFLDDLK